MNDSEVMDAFVSTTGCRRAVMSWYMDGKQLSCRELQARADAAADAAAERVEVAYCDNCEEQQYGGQKQWQQEEQLQARQEQVVRAKLEELSLTTCAYCWGMLHEVFRAKGKQQEEEEPEVEEQEEEQQEVEKQEIDKQEVDKHDAEQQHDAEQRERKAAVHSLWQCPRLGQEGLKEIDKVRSMVRYSREVKTCWKCGLMDYLCGREQGGEQSSRQADCAWPNVAIPVLCGLRAAAEAKARLGLETGIKGSIIWQAGYRGQIGSKKEVGRWIGEVCYNRRIFRQRVSRGVGVIIEAILEEEREKREKDRE